MKYIITEQQYKTILNEQNSVVKIGCRDYGLIPKYCETLRLSKQEADQIITANVANDNKKLSDNLEKLSQELLSVGGSEGKKMAKKFSSAIKNAKLGITQIISKYYAQAIYASAGLSGVINISQVLLEICNVLYSEFLKTWNDSFIERNAAKLFVTKKNIPMIQEAAKDIWNQVVKEVSDNVEFYFDDSAYFVVNDYVKEKEKSTPKCEQVKIIQDQGCNKPFPKEKWYSPNKTYKLGYPSPSGRVDTTSVATRTYLPKINEFLNTLV